MIRCSVLWMLCIADALYRGCSVLRMLSVADAQCRMCTSSCGRELIDMPQTDGYSGKISKS